MASSLAPASWALPLQTGGAGAVAAGPSCRAMLAVAEPRWSASPSRARVLMAPRCAALDGPGGASSEAEAKIEEEAGARATGVEADPVRLEEDTKHHHRQCPHDHLWSATNSSPNNGGGDDLLLLFTREGSRRIRARAASRKVTQTRGIFSNS